MANKIKKTVVTTAALGTGVVVAGNTTQASANSIYDSAVQRATQAGAGSDRITGTAPDLSKLNTLNAQLRNFAETNNNVTLVGTVSTSAEELTNIDSKLSSLKTLMTEYRGVKASIDTQVRNNLELTGRLGQTEKIVITGTTYEEIERELREAVEKAKQLKTANEQKIKDALASSNVANRELNKAVVNANKTISNASANVVHYSDGITGNLDKIKRKAEDSKAINGVVVDTTKTTKVNTITTNQTQKETVVTSIVETNRELQRILTDIQAQAKVNSTKALSSADYKDEALLNIDDINKWLEKERVYADNVQEEIKKNTTSIQKVDTYKTDYEKKLLDLKTYIEDPATPGKPHYKAQILKEIEKGLSKIRAAVVHQNVTHNVETAKDLDFGDIGRPNAEVKKIQNDATNQIRTIVQQAIADLAVTNAPIEKEVANLVAKNTSATDKFIERVKKGGSGSKIADAWLQELPIYKQSAKYRNMITNVLSMTSSSTDGVLRDERTDGNLTIYTVDPKTPAGLASAAIYEKSSEKGLDQGFGSVMLPSRNINDFTQTLGVPYADSASYPGGAQGILNDMLKLSTEFNDRVWAVIKDVKTQYIDRVGNSNTRLLLSTSNEIELVLRKAFVFVDDKGITQEEDILLTLKSSFANGTEPTGTLKNMYLYYMAVDPDTGGLLLGTGYVIMFTGQGTSGSVGTGTGGEHGFDSTYWMDLHDAGQLDYSSMQSADVGGKALTGINWSIGKIGGGGYVDNSGVMDVDVGGDISGDSEPVVDYTPKYYHTPAVVTRARYVAPPRYLTSKDTLANDIIHNKGFRNSLDLDNNKQFMQSGISLDIKVQVATLAAPFAVNAPLYISDIDDGQKVLINDTKADIITTQGLNIRRAGTTIELDSTDTSRTQGISGEDTVDGQSFIIKGNDDTPGLTEQDLSIQRNGNYTAIDIKLFTPFGVISTPSLNLEDIDKTISTFTISDPTAIAHTEGTYNITNSIEYLKPENKPTTTPVDNIDVKIELPTIVHTPVNKIVSSNTSLIVRRLADKVKRTASGNSLVVRSLDRPKNVASGNSFVVRYLEKQLKTASGNSFVVRYLNRG